MNEQNPSSRAIPRGDDDPTQVITGRPAPAPDEGATVISATSPTLAPGQTPTIAPSPASRVGTVIGSSSGSAQAGLLPVGSHLAEFEVTRFVGQGGFGVVYEAWDPTPERMVAIKE